jgi:two-component system alkaline phosphatase synthesis response regulator PhoP
MHLITIVEDESSLMDLIGLNLELEGYSTLRFSSGGSALRSIDKIIESELVILDVMLPEISGLDLCREIRKHSDIPILFLSAKGSTADRIAGLKLGANDYLPKPFDLEELLLKVGILIHKGVSPTTPDQLRVGTKEIDFNAFHVTDIGSGFITELSKKEIELLRLFNEFEGRVVSRDEILDRLWGKDQFPTTRTIDNYILSFRKLFEKDPKNPLYFHSIRSVGYKFTNDQN